MTLINSLLLTILLLNGCEQKPETRAECFCQKGDDAQGIPLCESVLQFSKTEINIQSEESFVSTLREIINSKIAESQEFGGDAVVLVEGVPVEFGLTWSDERRENYYRSIYKTVVRSNKTSSSIREMPRAAIDAWLNCLQSSKSGISITKSNRRPDNSYIITLKVPSNHKNAIIQKVEYMNFDGNTMTDMTDSLNTTKARLRNMKLGNDTLETSWVVNVGENNPLYTRVETTCGTVEIMHVEPVKEYGEYKKFAAKQGSRGTWVHLLVEGKSFDVPLSPNATVHLYGNLAGDLLTPPLSAVRRGESAITIRNVNSDSREITSETIGGPIYNRDFNAKYKKFNFPIKGNWTTDADGNINLYVNISHRSEGGVVRGWLLSPERSNLTVTQP